MSLDEDTDAEIHQELDKAELEQKLQWEKERSEIYAAAEADENAKKEGTSQNLDIGPIKTKPEISDQKEAKPKKHDPIEPEKSDLKERGPEKSDLKERGPEKSDLKGTDPEISDRKVTEPENSKQQGAKPEPASTKVAKRDDEGKHLQSFVISKTFSSDNVVLLLNLRKHENGEWVLDKTITKGYPPQTDGGVLTIDKNDFIQQSHYSKKAQESSVGMSSCPLPKELKEALEKMEEGVSKMNRDIQIAREMIKNANAITSYSKGNANRESRETYQSQFDELPFVDKLVKMFGLFFDDDGSCVSVNVKDVERRTSEDAISYWLRNLMQAISGYYPTSCSTEALKGNEKPEPEIVFEEVKKSGLITTLSNGGLLGKHYMEEKESHGPEYKVEFRTQSAEWAPSEHATYEHSKSPNYLNTDLEATGLESEMDISMTADNGYMVNRESIDELDEFIKQHQTKESQSRAANEELSRATESIKEKNESGGGTDALENKDSKLKAESADKLPLKRSTSKVSFPGIPEETGVNDGVDKSTNTVEKADSSGAGLEQMDLKINESGSDTILSRNEKRNEKLGPELVFEEVKKSGLITTLASVTEDRQKEVTEDKQEDDPTSYSIESLKRNEKLGPEMVFEGVKKSGLITTLASVTEDRQKEVTEDKQEDDPTSYSIESLKRNEKLGPEMVFEEVKKSGLITTLSSVTEDRQKEVTEDKQEDDPTSYSIESLKRNEKLGPEMVFKGVKKSGLITTLSSVTEDRQKEVTEDKQEDDPTSYSIEALKRNEKLGPELVFEGVKKSGLISTLSSVTEDRQGEVTENKQEEVTENKQEEVTENKQKEVTENKQKEVTENKQGELTENKLEEVTKKKEFDEENQIQIEISSQESSNQSIKSTVTYEDDERKRPEKKSN